MVGCTVTWIVSIACSLFRCHALTGDKTLNAKVFLKLSDRRIILTVILTGFGWILVYIAVSSAGQVYVLILPLAIRATHAPSSDAQTQSRGTGGKLSSTEPFLFVYFLWRQNLGLRSDRVTDGGHLQPLELEVTDVVSLRPGQGMMRPSPCKNPQASDL